MKNIKGKTDTYFGSPPRKRKYVLRRRRRNPYTRSKGESKKRHSSNYKSFKLDESEKLTTESKEESQSQYSTGNSYSFSAYSDGATSWKSFEDRPILGAWTIDEVRQISARSSPRKSPSHNPDETPIIGTIGSYWSHTGQTTDSSNSYTAPIGMFAKSRRNRENKAISCHSSPSKKRLERVFDKAAA